MGPGHEAATQRRPRVALVTAGSLDGQDAIGDYTRRLCSGLQPRGVDARHVEHDDWSVRGLRTLLRSLDQLRPDVVHVQHPQSVYGHALTPQLLSVLRPGVVTLHEASRYGPVRGRARLLPFLIRSRRVVVTSELERGYVLGFAPWARKRVSVVPLASNIALRPSSELPRERRLVYFGSIRPGKGLERFLNVAARLAGGTDGVECVVIGNPVRSSTEYARRLRASSAGTAVRWLSGLDAEGVAEELSRARVAFLPFPDGASERRGSLLATLGSGLPTVTRVGRQTTPSIRASVCAARTDEDALNEIHRLLSDDDHWTTMSARALQYGEGRTWDGVVEAHCRMYAELSSRRGSG